MVVDVHIGCLAIGKHDPLRRVCLAQMKCAPNGGCLATKDAGVHAAPVLSQKILNDHLTTCWLGLFDSEERCRDTSPKGNTLAVIQTFHRLDLVEDRYAPRSDVRAHDLPGSCRSLVRNGGRFFVGCDLTE